MKKVKIVINPISGIKDKSKVPGLIESELDQTRFSSEIVYTEYRGHAREIAEASLTDGTDIILVVGGDGSINEIAEPLLHSNVTLGIIPGGSGNGIARHFGMKLNFKKALRQINQFRTLKIDTGRINGRFFLGFCGIGYDAHIAHRFDKMGNRGFWNYVKLVLRELKSFSPMKILLPKKPVLENIFVCSFMNTSQFGNNFKLSPRANPCDGEFDMIIAKKPHILGVLHIFYLGFFGDINRSKFVERESDSSFSLNNPSGIAHVDGDPIKLEGNTVEVTCIPQSLTIIVGK
jgi:diacylglycerol kinase (ATP)